MHLPLRLLTPRRLTVFLALIAAAGCANTGLTPTRMINATDTTMGERTKRRDEDLILVTMRNEVHDRLTQGETIQAVDRLPPRYAEFMAEVAAEHGLRRVADWPLAALDIRCLVFRSDPNRRAQVVAALASHPDVESAQPLQYFQTLSSPGDGYDDPFRELQHSLTEMQIWRSHRYATGNGVSVAVIDTGLDTRHKEFAKRVKGVRNFVDRDSMDSDVHGTAVAGVIAANANNGEGMVGVAPGADLIGLKACWHDGDSVDHAFCSSFTLAKALNFAILQGVHIINLSLSGPKDPLLARLVQRAQRDNIVVVGAVNAAEPDQFPANVPGVLAVTTGDAHGAEERFVRAPGVKILSTLPNQDYDFYSGSSVAAGHVSGIAALMRQLDPELAAERLATIVKGTADPVSGAVNACRALAAIVSSMNCDASSTVSAL